MQPNNGLPHRFIEYDLAPRILKQVLSEVEKVEGAERIRELLTAYSWCTLFGAERYKGGELLPLLEEEAIDVLLTILRALE